MAQLTGLARRLAAPLALLFLVACLAGATVALGGAVAARARSDWARVPREARFFVVVRSPLADAAGEALAALDGARVAGEPSLGDLLGHPTTAVSRQPRLRVLEVAVDLTAPGGELAVPVEALRSVDGVVDVVDIDAAGRAVRTPARAMRLLALGLALVAVGCAAFVAGVSWVASLAALGSGDEIVACFLLGAELRRLWAPVAVLMGATATLGVGVALVAVRAVLWLVPAGPAPEAALRAAAAGAGETPPMAVGAIALVLGASTVAALAARRAVGRATRAGLAAAVLLGLLLAPPAIGGGEEPWGDRQELRVVARDLAVTTRALHGAELDLTEAEMLAVRAVASGDPTRVRLAAARREADARQVEWWTSARAALVARRAALRELRRAEPGAQPPIGPRLAPVSGRLAVGFGENGATGWRGFRGGVALRTRPGEVVRAAAPGRVVFAGELGGPGPVVVLSHGRRTYSVYARVAEILVARGMQVAAGESVAVAPQAPALLYFAVRERGRAVDPLLWLRAAGRSADGQG